MALIQSTGTSILGVGSTSTSWSSPTTTGNLIVVGISLTNAALIGTVSAVTDNQNNVYKKVASGNITSLADVLNVELWYAPSILGGAGSVTVTHTIDNCSMYAREYSGLFNVLDGAGSASGSSTTPTAVTSATTQGNELVIVVNGDDKGATQTWAAAGAFGNATGTATTITGLGMTDNTVNVTGVQTGTMTLGSAANWDQLIATFGRITNPRLVGQGMGGQ